MEELLDQLADIIEVESIDVNKKFTDYDEWDSLCSLSVIAMLDARYRITMNNKELLAFPSIEEFCKAVIK